MEFVAETAKILRKNSRLQQFVLVADRSIELLQGNLKLRKIILLQITIGYGCDIEGHECTDVLKYYLAVEKMLDDSVGEKKLRIGILLQIEKAYILTADYRKTLEYTIKAEKFANQIKDKKDEALCCQNLGDAYLSLAEYEKAITYYQKGLEISSAIGDRSGIASNNGNLGNAYLSLGEYEKAITYYQKGLELEQCDWGSIGNSK